ncbi:hypothetical protein KCU78_g3811, partial [Aureobasidium melanogenum]
MRHWTIAMQHLPKFGLARRTVVLFSLSVGLLLIWIALSSSFAVNSFERDRSPPTGDLAWDLPALDVPPVSCVGPRGLRLNESINDQLQSSFHDFSIYPEPISGSFEALDLSRSWTTVDERYGPYGFRQTEEGYQYSQVDWNKVRWGSLQNQCALDNSQRLPNHSNLTSMRRFQYRKDHPPAKSSRNAAEISSVRDAREKYGKQAIVLRAWSTYPYTDDDKQNLRSIVAEAALASHGKYNVFLLVDVKDLDAHVHSDDAGHASVLEKSVPQEFRDMAVLFDTTMLESWYPAVVEHSPFWQMMQPLQLFSQLYPEFDHYWQLEMDVRVTQHVGQILDAFDKFGEDQPRKQSHERASWSYMPQFHGTYADFTQKINSAMPNGTGTWGPIRIGPEILPIGPKPPSPKPYDTEANWEWGIGEPADLLLLNSLMDVRRLEDWPFRHWHYGFTKDKDLPYWHSPPAQGRASWNLLNAIHHAQSRQDLRIASETTLPSFALWHGLKLVGLPLPIFQDPERNRDELNFVLNGGDIEQFPDGFANGPVNTRGASIGFFVRGRSFDWVSPMPDRTMAYWKGEKQPDDDMPEVLVKRDGKIYAAAMFMHPRKTNFYRSD